MMFSISNKDEKNKKKNDVIQSKMPIWLDDNHIDPKWIESAVGISPCQSCTVVEDISNERRRSKKKDAMRYGATLRLTIKNNPHSQQLIHVIVKQSVTSDDNDNELAKRLGLSREALFYQQLSSFVYTNSSSSTLPKVYYSYGDMDTGNKFIMMEDLSTAEVAAIDSGWFFGPGNPNYWNRRRHDLLDVIHQDYSSRQVAMATFLEIAKVHATFWKQEELLSSDKSWLRGKEWLQGENRTSWESSQNLIRALWNDYKRDIASQDEKQQHKSILFLNWDENVRSTVEKAIQGISWESRNLHHSTQSHWTLVHGDFWPGNVMWIPQTTTTTHSNNKSCCHPSHGSLKLIDWEMVGLGSGPQELGQYIISNMDPTERKKCERDLIKAYHNELIQHTKTIITWEYCWSEYKIGGIERWIWFLVYFLGTGKIDWAQFFHDQISAFMKDHNMTKYDISQPRP
jgi:thiamine kinase-like enzyme